MEETITPPPPPSNLTFENNLLNKFISFLFDVFVEPIIINCCILFSEIIRKIYLLLVILGWRHVQCLLLFFGTTIGYALRGCMSVAIVAMRNSTANHSTFPVSTKIISRLFQTKLNCAMYEILIQQYDWDQSTSTIILGSFFWGYVLTQIPAGHFARTKSALKILSAGIFTSSLLNMLIPFIAKFGPVSVICTRVAMGFFSGCLLPCTYTLMSRWIPPSERSRLG